MKENRSLVKERLEALRSRMAKEAVDLALFTSTDPHGSEYVGDYFKVSEFFSACTSDNVVLLVEKKEARLWTDGRYFISAAGELEGSGIILMRMGETGVPTVEEYLKERLGEGSVLAFDGTCVSGVDGRGYERICQEKKAFLKSDFEPAGAIWRDRPAMPSHPVWVMSDAMAGLSFEKKAKKVRKEMEKAGADWLVLSKLDDIMWLLNIRGADVAYNPVALSYLVLGMESADLFIQPSEAGEEVKTYARDKGIRLHDYDAMFAFAENYGFTGNVMVDPAYTSYRMLTALKKNLVDKSRLLEGDNPTGFMKAIKNPVELERSRETYLLDSAALCHFIYYVKKHVGKVPMTEVSLADKLEEYRSKVEGFLGLSFATISAYKANAAMAHYAPDRENCSELAAEGFLLVDSGGQYQGGTTDVTRTMALGALSPAMVRDFTLVAMANLRLLYAKFPYGCSGVNLDTYARAPFWDRGLDYNHGTGHGIGYVLNVHEGPQNIRWKARGVADETVFEPGMFISDEPGMYVEGEYGIRTESILECLEAETTQYGRFLKFAPLTYVPIDKDALDLTLMDRSDVEKLNDYHRQVWEKVSPYMEGAMKDWLREATEAVPLA